MSGLEDLKKQIKMRGLTEGSNFQTPLKEFVGTFDDFDAEYVEKFQRTNVKLMFKDIEVIRSSEPYEFPIATLSIGLSNKKQSKWGIFAASALPFLPMDPNLAEDDPSQPDISALKGHRIHLVLDPNGFSYFSRAENKQITYETWKVVSVDGSGSETGGQVARGKKADDPLVAALKLLDGKSDREFNMAALRNDTIKSDADLVKQILNNGFVSSVVSQGYVEKDSDGKYHLTDAVAAIVG